MTLRNQTVRDNEFEPLLQVLPARKPYQAYCVTEAASSRPPSPIPCESPQNQCSTPVAKTNDTVVTQLQQSSPLSPPPPPIHALFTIPSTRQPEQRKQCQQRSNKKSPAVQSISRNEHHITPTVAPRGSHPLDCAQTSVCHEALSHPRRELPKSHREHESEQKRRRSPCLPVHVGRKEVDENECGVTRDLCDFDEDDVLTKSVSLPKEGSKHSDAPVFRHYQGDNARQESSANSNIVASRGLEFADEYRTSLLSRSSPDLTRSPNKLLPLDSNASARHVSNPRTSELFIPKTLPLVLHPEHSHHSNPRPKHLFFKRRLSTDSSINLRLLSPKRKHRLPPSPSLPSPTRPSASAYAPWIHPTITPSASTTSLLSSSSSQIGPRPPPWGSYQVLESQRKLRGDARGRENVLKLPDGLDSAVSLHQGAVGSQQGLVASQIRDGSEGGEERTVVRREVDVFREQILMVYPDLVLESGQDGRGKRGRCCCVVM